MSRDLLLTELGAGAGRRSSTVRSRAARCVLGLLLGCASLAAQSGLEAPAIGMFRSGGGYLRPLLGIRGNFLAGEAAVDDVESAAFSGSGGFVATGKELVATDRDARPLASRPAQTAGAVLGIDRSGKRAAAWLPESGEMTLWTGEGWESTVLTPGGVVVGVAPGAENTVRMAIDEGNGVRLVDVFPRSARDPRSGVPARRGGPRMARPGRDDRLCPGIPRARDPERLAIRGRPGAADAARQPIAPDLGPRRRRAADLLARPDRPDCVCRRRMAATCHRRCGVRFPPGCERRCPTALPATSGESAP